MPLWISKTGRNVIIHAGTNGRVDSLRLATKSQKDDPIGDGVYRAGVRPHRASRWMRRTGGGTERPVKKALSYLDDRIGEWRDAYLVGTTPLRPAGIQHETHIANARRLLSRAGSRGGRHNLLEPGGDTTPFYGWGSAGR